MLRNDLLCDSSYLKQLLDGICRLSAGRKPLLSLFHVHLDFGWVSQRIIGTDLLDELTVAGRPGVGDYNSLKRLFLCAHPLQSYLYHVFTTFRLSSGKLYS